ncbi:MAG: hypothetical protein VX871_08040 [Pseudomonadota bacterium]|nr:hypothetical protein [Pseudomonadota bacterium]
MWKAIFVLFMTTSQTPVSTVMGVFPQSFTSERACRAFVDLKKEEMGDAGDVLARVATSHLADPEFKLLNHKMSCVVDDSGDPA